MILVKGRGHMFDPMVYIVTNFIPSISLVYIARTIQGHPFTTPGTSDLPDPLLD